MCDQYDEFQKVYRIRPDIAHKLSKETLNEISKRFDGFVAFVEQKVKEVSQMDPTLPFLAKANNAATVDPKLTPEYQELKRNLAELTRIVKECVADIQGLSNSLARQPFQPWKAQYVDLFRAISHKLEDALPCLMLHGPLRSSTPSSPPSIRS